MLVKTLKIEHTLLTDKQVELRVARLDLAHAPISGNKYYKLKYNLREALRQGKKTVLSFGGAYSNHLLAAARACRQAGLALIAVVRGEETLPLNPILTEVADLGAHLHYISREAYRHKTNPTFIAELHRSFGDFYLVPEGGSNVFALHGTREIPQELPDQDWDCILTPCGTGGTLAGLALGLEPHQYALGIAVLKQGDFLHRDIGVLHQAYQQHYGKAMVGRYDIILNYHAGGYAKTNLLQRDFMTWFAPYTKLPIEAVYSGKMFWAIWDLISRDYFAPHTRLMALQTTNC